ncbi:hypothetical protein Tco_0554539 [Tanacetum coccineum]
MVRPETVKLWKFVLVVLISSRWFQNFETRWLWMGLNMLLDIVILDYNALCPIKAKSCTCWQLSHADYLLSLPFLMADAAQNINNTTIRSILLAEKLTGSNFTNWHRNMRIVLKYEKKMKFVEQLIGPAPDPETADPDTIDKYYETINLKQEAKHELFETVKAFYACKQEEGQSVSSYLLKMKSYLDTLERLGYAMPNELGVSLILNSLNKDYDQFGIPKKAETPAVLAIREVDQKDKKKPRGAKDAEVKEGERLLRGWTSGVLEVSKNRKLKLGALSLYMAMECVAALSY